MSKDEVNKLRQISSCVLDNETIIEMCLDLDRIPQTFFAICEDGKVFYENQYKIEEEVLMPMTPQKDVIKNKLVRFASKAEEYIDESALVKEIGDFVHMLVDVTPAFHELIPYYVMFTWLYDSFHEVPYLRAIGDFGTGKSRFLKVVGNLCYKPMFVGHCTASYAFRTIEHFRGTLILDEADFKKSSEEDKFVKILNCGYEKGTPYGVTEKKGKGFEEKSYNVFGPKVIATRKNWQDTALESRCLSEEMISTKRRDIPLNWKTEFDGKAVEIRNKLLMWRFRNRKSINLSDTEINVSIEPRLRQIITPLLSISNNDVFNNNLVRFAERYNQELIMARGLRFEAIIVEVIDRMHSTVPGERIYMKDIAETINIDFENSLDKKVNAIKVGHLIKRLGFRPGKDRNGSHLQLNIDREKIKLEQAKYRYGINSESDDVTSVMD